MSFLEVLPTRQAQLEAEIDSFCNAHAAQFGLEIGKIQHARRVKQTDAAYSRTLCNKVLESPIPDLLETATYAILAEVAGNSNDAKEHLEAMIDITERLEDDQAADRFIQLEIILCAKFRLRSQPRAFVGKWKLMTSTK